MSQKANLQYKTPTLAEWPLRVVRLACEHYDRRGQYRKDMLIAKFGGDVLMPDLQHKIANCSRRDAPGQACGVYFADLR